MNLILIIFFHTVITHSAIVNPPDTRPLSAITPPPQFSSVPVNQTEIKKIPGNLLNRSMQDRMHRVLRYPLLLQIQMQSPDMPIFSYYFSHNHINVPNKLDKEKCYYTSYGNKMKRSIKKRKRKQKSGKKEKGKHKIFDELWETLQFNSIFFCNHMLLFIKDIIFEYQQKMSFIFNMFGKGQKEQLTKYDRITFKINLSEHIPQYYEATSNKAITETEITPDHPLYYEIFPKKELAKVDNNYIQYVAKENDTIFGIAIRLDISEQYLRNINGISGSLYPGMVIKLPKDTDLTKLQQEDQVHQTERLRISQLLNSDKSNNNVNYKYQIYYYAGPSGDIKGVLTVNNNYIIFNPLLQEEENLKKFTIQKLLKFNVLVEMADIQKAESLRIPIMQEYTADQQPKYNNIVQFMLFKVGNLKVEKKYRQRLKQLKLNNKAIASISFSFRNQSQAVAKKQSQQLTNNINSLVNQVQGAEEQEQSKKRLTNIPFFDIINDKPNEEKEIKQQINHILTKSAILGTLSDQSDILTPAHFQNLAKKFPLLYRLYNWQRVFTARKDGSAFHTFLNKIKDVEPAILLIKQYKGNILGAFLVESIEAGKTGRGQMFIFTFRGDSKQPQVYGWTTKNDFFVYLQKDQGIGIGMGVKYGLFINRNLEKGSSAATKTFGNTDKLSENEDFLIDEIQYWGIDNSF